MEEGKEEVRPGIAMVRLFPLSIPLAVLRFFGTAPGILALLDI